MWKPLVSILIPFKDTEAYLPECIESILRQDYRNLEVLIVDDGSSDNSYDLVEQYALRDDRLKPMKNQGQGIIHALRTAYLQCSGELVTRMDSDDIMTRDKIATMVGLMVENGQGHVAIGQIRYFSHQGIGNGYKRYEEWLNGLTDKGSNYDGLYKECAVPSPCWMVYKKDLDRCGAFGPERYPEDYDLAFRFYENGLQCIPCDKVLHYWRDYDTRTSRTSEHYAANYFLDIKLHYFLKLEYNPQKRLVVWGAGNKGKTIAKSLLAKEIDFGWVCDNPRKINRDIYGEKLEHFHILDHIDDYQCIVTVANEKEQETIKTFLSGSGKKPMVDYFFFC